MAKFTDINLMCRFIQSHFQLLAPYAYIVNHYRGLRHLKSGHELALHLAVEMRPVIRLLPASVILVILTMLNYHVNFQNSTVRREEPSSRDQFNPSVRSGESKSSNITGKDSPCKNVGTDLRGWLEEEIQDVYVDNRYGWHDLIQLHVRRDSNL